MNEADFVPVIIHVLSESISESIYPSSWLATPRPGYGRTLVTPPLHTSRPGPHATGAARADSPRRGAAPPPRFCVTAAPPLALAESRALASRRPAAVAHPAGTAVHQCQRACRRRACGAGAARPLGATRPAGWPGRVHAGSQEQGGWEAGPGGA